MRAITRYRLPDVHGIKIEYSNFATYSPAQESWYTTDRRVFEAFCAGITAGKSDKEDNDQDALEERLRQCHLLARAFNQVTESSNAYRCHGIILDYLRERAMSFPEEMDEEGFWRVRGLGVSESTCKVYQSAVRQYLKWEREMIDV